MSERETRPAVSMGIPQENVIIDCLVMTVGTDHSAAAATQEAIRRVRAELGNNVTAGVSNVSFGLPDRDIINETFLLCSSAPASPAPSSTSRRACPLFLAADMSSA